MVTAPINRQFDYLGRCTKCGRPKDEHYLNFPGVWVCTRPGHISEVTPEDQLKTAANSIRKFETGATRDAETDKIDPEGFISPLCERRFCQYMHRHRKQSDGTLRASDNWQRGIPKDAYMKSLRRHMLELWLIHRGYPYKPKTKKDPQDIEEILCAIRFNADGYLFELLKERESKVSNPSEAK